MPTYRVRFVWEEIIDDVTSRDAAISQAIDRLADFMVSVAPTDFEIKEVK